MAAPGALISAAYREAVHASPFNHLLPIGVSLAPLQIGRDERQRIPKGFNPTSPVGGLSMGARYDQRFRNCSLGAAWCSAAKSVSHPWSVYRRCHVDAATHQALVSRLRCFRADAICPKSKMPCRPLIARVAFPASNATDRGHAGVTPHGLCWDCPRRRGNSILSPIKRR